MVRGRLSILTGNRQTAKNCDPEIIAWGISIRSINHSTLQATPCQLVFDRNMVHNFAFRSNWDLIQKEKRSS
jgi:hypothetical protein